MDIQTANKILMDKRQELGIAPGQQPQRISPEVLEVGKSENDYWLKLRAGEPTGNLAHAFDPKQPFVEFDSDRHDQLKVAIRTVKKWFNRTRENGGAVVLAGGTGCGKTHIATDIKNYVGYNCVMYNENDLIKAIQNTYGNYGGKTEESIVLQCERAGLLILDDLGTYGTNNLEWIQNIYYKLINGRTEKNKAVMITTNLAMGNAAESPLRERVGQRVFSRLLGAMKDPEFYIDLFQVGDYRMRGW